MSRHLEKHPKCLKNYCCVTNFARAWWGFTAASDRQKVYAFIRRGVRLKFYSHDDPTMAELADELDETLKTFIHQKSIR